LDLPRHVRTAQDPTRQRAKTKEEGRGKERTTAPLSGTCDSEKATSSGGGARFQTIFIDLLIGNGNRGLLFPDCRSGEEWQRINNTLRHNFPLPLVITSYEVMRNFREGGEY